MLGLLSHMMDVVVTIAWLSTLWDMLLQAAKKKEDITYPFFWPILLQKALFIQRPPWILLNRILMKWIKAMCVVQIQQQFRGPQIMSLIHEVTFDLDFDLSSEGDLWKHSTGNITTTSVTEPFLMLSSCLTIVCSLSVWKWHARDPPF